MSAAGPPLRCPHCHHALQRQSQTWSCSSGHAFDVARQGYVNLLPGHRAHTGDTVDMLAARSLVLGAGHFDRVTDAVITACQGLPDGVLIEAGAGTGHHLALVRRALQRPAVAMDISVAAARRAARAGPRELISLVTDVWQPWPVLDRVAAAVLMIFAPRNLAEAARVLVPGGVLVVVTPAEGHLGELRSPLDLIDVEPDKSDRLNAQARRVEFQSTDTRVIRDVVPVDRGVARALALMGPSAHHLDTEDLDLRVAALPERTDVTIAVTVHRYRVQGGPGTCMPEH